MDKYINELGDDIKQKIAEGAISIVKGIAESSYGICLGVSMVALVLYLVGFKKAGKWVGGSIIIFFFLQAIKVAL